MLTYKRNLNELVWYQEYIYKNDELIGEIFTNIDEGGYNLRHCVDVSLADDSVTEVMETIAHFTTVCNAKDFVNLAWNH